MSHNVIDKTLWIIPTRGRSHRIAEHAESLRRTLTGYGDVMYVVDGDHEGESTYFHNVLPFLCHVGPWRGLSGTLNFYANHWAHFYTQIGFMGDDHFPRTVGFDAEFYYALKNNPHSVTYGMDGAYTTVPTYWAMSSSIIQNLGQMVPYVLRHNYIDNYIQDLASGADALTRLDNVLVEHMHPLWDKAESDPSYELSSYHHSRLSDQLNYEEYKTVQLPKDVVLLRRLRGLDRDLEWV